MEKLDFLIQYLLDERKEKEIRIPKDEEEKKSLYRALVNIREPLEISEDFLKIEDEYLQEVRGQKGIVEIDKISIIAHTFEKNCLKSADKICLWQGDITKLKIDAIVNAANSGGLGCFSPNHHCIDNQIHTFAGVRLRLECSEKVNEIGGKLKTGEVFITKGYNLPAQNVIHTVGPIVGREVIEEDKVLLANCYENSLKLAAQNHLRTIAFPTISTGVFMFPKDEASKIAIKTVDNFLVKNQEKFDKVVFCVYTEDDEKIYEKNLR